MEELAGKQPHESFEKYVNAELEKMIVKETNHYAAQKNKNSTLTVTDIETFNAVLILTGYHLLPRTRMFWETQENIHLLNFLDIYELISRNESEDIKRYIHFADNNQSDKKDRFAKVRKLYDIMNKNFQQFNFFHSYYAVDEEMVLYNGKIAANKQFEQLSILGTNVLSRAPMMINHTLLTRIVVPNTVGRKKHLRIFVLTLLSIVCLR